MLTKEREREIDNEFAKVFGVDFVRKACDLSRRRRKPKGVKHGND